MSEGVQRYVDAGKRAVERRAQWMKEMKKCRFDTLAVHGMYNMQEALDFNQGSIIEPVYLASSQGYRDSDEMEAGLSYQIPTWCYSRIGNPSMYYMEGLLALMEGYGFDGETGCCATASGMSAIMSATDPFLVVDPKKPGAKINFVATCQVYGGTFQQFAIRKMEERGIECRWVINSHDMGEWESKIDENTRFLYGEMPSNPGQAFFDLKVVAELAHSRGIPMIVDSTVASPALLRPIQHGADIVVQSVTKSLSSSGFGISGAVIARKNLVSKIGPEEMKQDFAMYIKALPNRDNGPNIHPMGAILAINDMRTLSSKMDLMSRNAQGVAEFLEGHSEIERVDYLGLDSHPLNELASKYMYLVDSEHSDVYGKKVNRYGHLMAFYVNGGAKRTRNVFDRLQRVWRATDLGRIKSVATIPAISTHSQQGEEGRKLAQIPDNMVRLCVGAEHVDDIKADLDQALKGAEKGADPWPVYEYSVGGASSAVLHR